MSGTGYKDRRDCAGPSGACSGGESLARWPSHRRRVERALQCVLGAPRGSEKGYLIQGRRDSREKFLKVRVKKNLKGWGAVSQVVKGVSSPGVAGVMGSED